MSGTEPSFRENPSEIILLHSRVRNSKEFRLLPQESYVVYRVWKFSLLQKGNQTRKNKKRNKYKRIYNSIVTSNCICITFILLVRKPCNQRPETTHIEPKVQESQGYSTLRPTARLQPKETFPENPRRRFRRQISLRNRRKRGQEELSFRQARNFAGRTV